MDIVISSRLDHTLATRSLLFHLCCILVCPRVLRSPVISCCRLLVLLDSCIFPLVFLDSASSPGHPLIPATCSVFMLVLLPCARWSLDLPPKLLPHAGHNPSHSKLWLLIECLCCFPLVSFVSLVCYVFMSLGSIPLSFDNWCHHWKGGTVMVCVYLPQFSSVFVLSPMNACLRVHPLLLPHTCSWWSLLACS